MDAAIGEILTALSVSHRVFWAGTIPPRLDMTASNRLFDAAADFRMPPQCHQAFDGVFLIEQDLGAIKQWPLILDEAMRLLAPGAVLVLRLRQSRLLSLFEVANFVEKWSGNHIALVTQAITDGEFTLALRLTTKCPRPASADDFAFGLITDGRKPAGVRAFVQSVLALDEAAVDRPDILICGPAQVLDDLAELASSVTLVPQPAEFTAQGWITRKKNLLVQAARRENILIAHDRYTLPVDFLRQMRNFGGDFDVLVPRQETADGHGIPDWVMLSDRLNWGTPGWLEYGDYHPFVYVNGGVTIAKKTRLAAVGWSELLFWDQAEDVDLTRRLQDAGAVPRLARTVRLVTGTMRWGLLEGIQRLPWVTGTYAETERTAYLATKPFEPVQRYVLGTAIDLTGGRGLTDSLREGVVLSRAWALTAQGIVWTDQEQPLISLKLADIGGDLELLLSGADTLASQIKSLMVNVTRLPMISPWTGPDALRIAVPRSAIPRTMILNIRLERTDAAPLELSRFELSHARPAPKYLLGTTLSMADIQARAYLARGWHQPEAWGVWSASMYAEVTLPLAADGHGDLKLHLSSRAIIAPGLSDQWIGVSVGGVAVGTLVYPASLSEQCDDFIVPAERVQGDEVVIGFHAARMASPAMVGLSEDKRPLGIGLLAITVSAA